MIYGEKLMIVLHSLKYPLYVSGSLMEIPRLKMDNKGEFFAVIKLQALEHTGKQFIVLIVGDEALKIRRYGFVGLSLLIKCECYENFLVGNKLVFIDSFTPSSEAQQSVEGCHYVAECELIQSTVH